MTASVGAIVFSTPYGGSGTGSGADWMNYWLSSAAYRHLVPWFLSIDGSNVVTGRGDTQAIKDKEIQQGAASGLDYFAYNFGSQVYGIFPNGPTVGYNGELNDGGNWKPYVDNAADGLTLHRSSAYKSLVKMAVTLAGSTNVLPIAGSDASWTTYVQPYLLTLLTDADYMKVLTNRPLMFIFNPTGVAAEFSSTAACKSALDSLRAAVDAVTGFGNPYIVGLNGGADMSTIKTDLGLDACGFYNRTTGAVGGTYDAWRSASVTQWATEATRYGTARIVCCSGGFTRQPMCLIGPNDRNTNPTLFGEQGFCTSWTIWNIPPTKAELKAHLAAAKVQAATTAADVVLLNAWYEADSATSMCPNHGNGGVYMQAVAEAYTRQRDSRTALNARGQLIVSR